VGEEIEQHQVLSVDTHRQGYRMTLLGVDSTQKASALIGCYVSIPEHQLEPLPEGVYYAFDIVGLTAYMEDGERIGDVVELLELPGNDVLVIDRGGREVLIPMVSEFIKEINPDERRIVVTPIEGMLGQE
jgi:16S rRNA processing protein RimM